MEMSGLCDLLPLSFTLFQNGTEIMKTGLRMYLSVGGFLLRGDQQIQGNIDGTTPDLRQIFPTRVFFRSSFLKCPEHTFVDSLILKSFPSSHPMACIHFFFNMFSLEN